MRDPDLQRLLRAAARIPADEPATMPFGFDTRVLALRRGGEGNGEWRRAALLLRRVALSALVVTLCASGAAWWQLQQSDELNTPTANAYSMADNVIDASAWQ